MTNKQDEVTRLLEKIESIEKDKKIDLSSGEDLSIGVMNLIGAEEHLFFTYHKTGNEKYLDLLNEVRLMRTELLRDLVKNDYEGEVWCISKHLLSASMRLMEVGTKELKKGDKAKAKDLFDKSYKLYTMFWAINLKAVKVGEIKELENINFMDEKNEVKKTASPFDKLGEILKKALDCCRE
jgi:hypothetical protein